jgi:outer membrane protein assembly factor BamB
MLALAAVLVLSGCDWTMFGLVPSHTRYNATENAISTSNVSGLVQRFVASTGGFVLSSPAVANGVVYVGSGDGKFYAFSATGTSGCSGTPISCSPLWVATTGGPVRSSPAVVNGVVYVTSDDAKLYAFDAAGTSNCSGIPKTCNPLWTASTGESGGSYSAPTVSGGVVYVGSIDDDLYAFDASGVTNCSGTPKTCSPLWTANTGQSIVSSPSVANGVVYVGIGESLFSSGAVDAYDAAGVNNCSGTPKTCSPLWADTTAMGAESSPAVTNGVLYDGTLDGHLYAFDAGGNTNCSGLPRTCNPLWIATAGMPGQLVSSPAVANGVVYVGSGNGSLYAFDAAGITGCAGIPNSCFPLWSAATGAGVYSSPAVAAGVVYVGSEDDRLYAFDAAGITNCSGSPKSCTSLWSATTHDIIESSPAVANGMVYVGSIDHSLYAYGLGPG